MRTRIPGKLWYPRHTTRGKKELEAIPLVSGNIRVNGSVMTPAEAIEMGVDFKTISVARSFKESR